jgi:hypothetical protein
MRILSIVSLLALSACAASPDHATSSMSDGSIVHAIRCENSWDSCYLAAARICGNDGFEEVERSADSGLSSVGRLERMHSIDGGIERHRYSENAQEESYNRVITIRCKRPR